MHKPRVAEPRGPACASICARAQAIAAAREAESVHLRRFAQLKAFSLLTGLVTPIVSLALTFVAYAWLHGGPPSVADSFTALALFKLLVLPFKSFVEGVAAIAQARVSLARMLNTRGVRE